MTNEERQELEEELKTCEDAYYVSDLAALRYYQIKKLLEEDDVQMQNVSE
jgi:hypothetical protein